MINPMSSMVPTPDKRDVDAVYAILTLASDPQAARSRIEAIEAARLLAEQRVAALMAEQRAALETECELRRQELADREAAVAAREARVQADADALAQRKADIEAKARRLIEMAN